MSIKIIVIVILALSLLGGIVKAAKNFVLGVIFVIGVVGAGYFIIVNWLEVPIENYVDKDAFTDKLNTPLLQTASDTIAVLKPLELKFSFVDKGLVFNNDLGLNGEIKENDSNNIYLKVSSPITDDKTISKLVLIASTFSTNNKEDKSLIEEMVYSNSTNKVKLSNGYCQIVGETLTVYLERKPKIE